MYAKKRIQIKIEPMIKLNHRMIFYVNSDKIDYVQFQKIYPYFPHGRLFVLYPPPPPTPLRKLQTVYFDTLLLKI